MVAISNPLGLQPVYHPSGLGRARIAVTDGITSGFGSNIFKNQPVQWTANAGVIVPVTLTTADFLGAFDGVEWTDTTGRRRVSNFWPSGTTYIAGSCVAYFYEDPEIIYEIQADGSLAQTIIYNQLNFSNLSSGSTTTGLSQCTAAAAGVGTGVQGQLRVLDVAPYPNNAWGDAFVIARVQVARSQQRANKVAI